MPVAYNKKNIHSIVFFNKARMSVFSLHMDLYQIYGYNYCLVIINVLYDVYKR